MKQGSFDVHLEHRKLDPVVNRMVMGILTAALFTGSAFILGNSVPPLFQGISVVGMAGCLAALFMGWRLILAVKRSGDVRSR
jgi:ubiquinone biosynthesis protein